jgi:hypothetical protein
MKEIDENKDEQSMMASEPVGAALRAAASTIGYDIDNWPGMPLVGPSNHSGGCVITSNTSYLCSRQYHA